MMEQEISVYNASNKRSNFEFPRFLRLTFDLSKNLRIKLAKNRIRLNTEIISFTNQELIDKFAFTCDEIEEINEKVRNLSCTNLAACSSNWIKQSQDEHIISGCKGLDFSFGETGLSTRHLTQISGEAGAGKSQICMQFCFRVQLENELGGLDGEALYLDTENAFRPERIRQIALNYFSANTTCEQNLLEFRAEEVLTRIHIRRVNTNAEDLFNIIVNGELELFFNFHQNVRLLILDSIAYHFRFDYEHHNDIRVQQLIQIASKLKQLAYERNIAILTTNQVKFSNSPSLGDLWNSVCSTSLLLSRNLEYDNAHNDAEKAVKRLKVDNTSIKTILSIRKCSVLKSSTIPNNYSFRYYITENGIED